MTMNNFDYEYEKKEAEYFAEFKDRQLPCYLHRMELVMKMMLSVHDIVELFERVKKLIRKIKGIFRI